MNKSYANTAKDFKIGIIGCGHLGQAISLSLIHHGFPSDNIFISYGGTPSTFNKLKSLGLDHCITDNCVIFEKADIIFVTIKPQDIYSLKGFSQKSDARIISCAAGVPLRLLEKVFDSRVFRMMISGPDTILAGKGITAVYPGNKTIEELLISIELMTFSLSSESDLDIFTVGVCLPAVILEEQNEEKANSAIKNIGKDFTLLPELYLWAKSVLPPYKDNNEKNEYIKTMMTKGGITEVIIRSLRAGESLASALHKGIERTEEISAETERLIKGNL